MIKSLKLFGALVLTVLTVCAISYATDRSSYSSWHVTKTSGDASPIAWANFQWTSDSINGKYFDRTSMNIPCRVDGVPNPVTFQFDLGADYTGVYENTFASLAELTPALKHQIKRFKSPFQFWDKRQCMGDLKMSFGPYAVENAKGFIYKAFGDTSSIVTPMDTIHLGSISADLFKNKVLIIDYPNKHFAICDNVPNTYDGDFADIELTKTGKVILPMQLRGTKYRILFDNGSSIFPLITEAKNIGNFSRLPDTDTIEFSSWGQKHAVTGKLIPDSFVLAGKTFFQVKVYANHSGLGIDKKTDGMAGNALFWDKTVLIDFKNKKFGIR